MRPVLIGKSSSVYLISFVIFAAGIWLILEFGSTMLHAREDLAGDWVLIPVRSAPEVIRGMQIEQSGKYLNITLGGGKPQNLVMTNETIIDQRFGDRKRLTLSNAELTMQFEGVSGGNVWNVTASGSAANGQWTGRIVERTYPRPATPAATAAAATTVAAIAQPTTQPRTTGINAQR